MEALDSTPQKMTFEHGEDSRYKYIYIKDKKGEEVGKARFVFHKKPFPFCYFHRIDIYPAHQGNGFGGQLVEYINNFLKETESVGFLINAVNSSERVYDIHTKEIPPIDTIYEHRDWKYLRDKNLFVMYFNSTTKRTSDELLNALAIIDPELAAYLRGEI